MLVDGCSVSSINQGLCILLGIAQDDTSDDLDYMVRKILNVKVFDNKAGDNMWARSVKDAGLEILCGNGLIFSECKNYLFNQTINYSSRCNFCLLQYLSLLCTGA